MIGDLAANSDVKDLQQSFERYKEEVRAGKHAKTAQFWLVNYLDIIHILNGIHIAVQESSYELRLKCWKEILPYFFCLNRTNYSRYGRYYASQLLKIHELFLGCKELLNYYGISVQGQDRYPLRTAVDQRGEQTLNRDAKTSGGITNFAGNIDAVTKWTLNRSAQAEVTGELKRVAGIEGTQDTYKQIRPHHIVNSNKMCDKLVTTISKDFTSPFSTQLSPDRLFNLTSGIPVDDAHAEEMLKIREIGKQSFSDFMKERIFSDDVKFHDGLPRTKVKLFKQCRQKVNLLKDGKMKTLEVNRNIISTLLAISAKTNRVIDFNLALEYPLSPVPLNIANADGSRRITVKSKLNEIIMKKSTLIDHETEMPTRNDHDVSTYIVDLMALVRTQRITPLTYEDLALQVIFAIPKGYKRVDIVADTYRSKSIKDPERFKRGCTDRVIVNSVVSHLPRNFNDFLKNGDNKTRLIELILDVLVQRRNEVLEILKTDELYYSMDNKCYLITNQGVVTVEDLSSNQEEADTKVVLHASHAVNAQPSKTVIVRNYSGDVDITVIMLSLIVNQCERVILDFNKGKDRKAVRLSDVDMSTEEKAALIGFHAFTGNDYVSAFFKKGKGAFWKILLNNLRFWRVFAEVGRDWLPSDNLIQLLEEFVCLLFGSR